MAYLIELYQMLSIFIRCIQVVIVRPLPAVSSLVRFAEEPQMFAIEFNDGCPIHVSIAWLPFEILCARWKVPNVCFMATGLCKHVSG